MRTTQQGGVHAHIHMLPLQVRVLLIWYGPLSAQPPWGQARSRYVAAKQLKLHRLLRRVAPESGQLVMTLFHMMPVYVLNIVGQIITCDDLHQTKEIQHINLARAQSTSLA